MCPLNAHDLKCNVNLLMPDQIIFCLADTENNKFKYQPYVLIARNRLFRIPTKIEAIMKSVLNFC